jgi:outer membrane protein assembly factor BamB
MYHPRLCIRRAARTTAILMAFPLALGACAPFELALRVASDVLSNTSCNAESHDRAPKVLGPGASLAWRRDHIRIHPSWGSTPLAAIGDRVFFLGTVDGHRESLNTLRASDGLPLSQGPRLGLPAWPWKLAASDRYLFATSSVGYVVAFEPASGESLWTTHLGFPHRALRFHTSDQLLFAESESALFVLDPESGVTLSSDLPAWTIAWSPDTNTAITSPARAFNTLTGDMQWESEVMAATASPPLVTEDVLFLRGGEFQGTLYALDRSTGTLLFASALPAVSNIARAGNSVYWLSSDAGLYSWAPGQTLESPIASFGDAALGIQCTPVGYFVAATSGGSSVIVYLGETDQLLALNLTS